MGSFIQNHHVCPGDGRSFREKAVHTLGLDDSSVEPPNGHVSACQPPFVPEPGFVDKEIHK